MAQLHGHKLQESIEINNCIDQLVQEVSSISAEIKGISDPTEQALGQNKVYCTALEENRGRGLFYPYLSTGIGRGCFVELEDGSTKLDLINGIGINIFGHSHPQIMKAAVKGAIQDVIMAGNLQPSREMLTMSQKMVELAQRKSRLNHSWLTTSGSMANENALKMCRQKTNGARMVIAMNAAFAGRTTMMAEVTDNDTMRVGLPRYNEILRIPFYDKNNPKSIEETTELFQKHVDENRGNICAFMFEPMQGEGGYNVAPREYFIPLFDICKKEGIPVFADEIQTFARTGEFFCYETLNIGEYIDICTVAKTIQGGCTLYTDELNPQPGLIAGTFAGSVAAISAGRAILDILDDEGYMGPDGKINEIHKSFVNMLNELNQSSCSGLLQDAGGLGLMVAVTPLDGSKDKMLELLKALYKNGMVAFGCGRGPYRVRFLIPAVITVSEIEVARSIIEKSILEIR